MSRYKEKPSPIAREVWTYWISRDSLQGELSGNCQLWYRKPIRVKHRYRVTWVCADHRDPGHLGEFSLNDIEQWFKTKPETDLELVRVEQYVTDKMRQESK